MASRRPVSKRTRVRPQIEPVAATPTADAERSTPDEVDISTPDDTAAEGSAAVAIGMLLTIVTIVALFMIAFIISA